MIPSTQTRIGSMVRALTTVVIPALQEDSFAAEQAALVVAHLNSFLAQDCFTADFEVLEYDYIRQLSEDLVVDADGGELTRAAVGELGAALQHGKPRTVTEMRAQHERLSALIAALIDAQGKDGTVETIRRSDVLVASQEQSQTLRLRSFFSSFGYEGTDDLPNLANTIADHVAAGQARPEG